MKQEAHWQFTCPCVIINKLMKMEEENLLKERETFGSRLGFILVSAGCAVGLGNVWKFPYMTGKYGGAAFILIYLVFLVLLGLPILVNLGQNIDVIAGIFDETMLDCVSATAWSCPENLFAWR